MKLLYKSALYKYQRKSSLKIKPTFIKQTNVFLLNNKQYYFKTDRVSDHVLQLQSFFSSDIGNFRQFYLFLTKLDTAPGHSTHYCRQQGPDRLGQAAADEALQWPVITSESWDRRQGGPALPGLGTSSWLLWVLPACAGARETGWYCYCWKLCCIFIRCDTIWTGADGLANISEKSYQG